jgi:putative ABC transport system substrate-binding protein
MTRRGTLLALAVLAALAHAPAAAETTKLPLIGRVSPGLATDPLHARVTKAFHDGMRALGHEEGRTYRFETRYADGDSSRLPALAADLLRIDARVTLAAGAAAIRAAKVATTDRPIVMAMTGIDPVRAGFAVSLAHPGGNITGMSGRLDDLNTKHLELIRELAPGAPEVMALYHAPSVDRQQVANLAVTGEPLKLRVAPAGITRSGDFATAFAQAARAKVGGVVILPEPAVMDRNRVHICELALRHRLPAVSALREYVDAGFLVSYGVDLDDIYRRAAGYVAKILNGAKPADLPIEQPTKFQLVINLKTAKALGLKIPAELLARADEVGE